MDDYKPNSHKSKEEQRETTPEKKVEKIITGSAKAKKKNGLQKFTDTFIPEDVDNVKSYIFEDIIVPAIKDIILDAVKAFLGANGKTGKYSTSSKMSYTPYYEKENSRRKNYNTGTRSGYSYDDIILDTRGEAEDVLSRMDELSIV